MDINDFEIIQTALGEVNRLVKRSGSEASEIGQCLKENANTIRQGYLINEPLFKLLQDSETPSRFLRSEDYGINHFLFKLLLIGNHFKSKANVPENLNELRETVKNDPVLKSHFGNRHDLSLLIIYFERQQQARWVTFAKSSDGGHMDLSTLNHSLPFCKTNLKTLLDLISKIKDRFPDRASYRLLAASILFNLKSDPVLRQSVLEAVDDFFLKAEWLEMLPYFFRGAINNDAELYRHQHGRLMKDFPQHSCSDRLYVLAVACPEDELSLFFFYHDAAKRRDENVIIPSDYLKLILARNRADHETIEYVTALAKKSRDKQELVYLSDYLVNLTDSHHAEEWFRNVAKYIIPSPFAETISNLDHLLTTLIDKDVRLVYELLTRRFAVNGSSKFLEGLWHELPDADQELFEEYLVRWFSSPNRFHHLALHHLTNHPPVNSDRFRLSAEKFNQLSKTERFLVSCKICGYVYDKHILRSLLFSLTENVREEETALLEELYAIFTGYVVHNYRSTLDEIKKLLATGSLKPHIIAFYQRIVDHFEAYFKGLDSVAMLIETRADPTLSQHVRYYTSHEVSEQMKGSHKEGLGRFFKNVTINSHRWAIRRPGEKKHVPQELSTIRSEMEFPAGEIINPVASERFRKVYQLIERDEINID